MHYKPKDLKRYNPTSYDHPISGYWNGLHGKEFKDESVMKNAYENIYYILERLGEPSNKKEKRDFSYWISEVSVCQAEYYSELLKVLNELENSEEEEKLANKEKQQLFEKLNWFNISEHSNGSYKVWNGKKGKDCHKVQVLFNGDENTWRIVRTDGKEIKEAFVSEQIAMEYLDILQNIETSNQEISNSEIKDLEAKIAS